MPSQKTQPVSIRSRVAGENENGLSRFVYQAYHLSGEVVVKGSITNYHKRIDFLQNNP